MAQTLPKLLLEMHAGINDIRDTLDADTDRITAAANAARLAQLEMAIEEALHILENRHEDHAVRVYQCQQLLTKTREDTESIPF